MEIKKQLSIFMENQPGNLAKFCSMLEDEKIDILGMTVTDAADHAVIRVVLDKVEKATHVFGNHGMVVIESDVLQIELATRPGELKKVAQIFSQEGINIDYIYGSETKKNGGATLFIKVGDTKRAFELLKRDLS